MKTTLDLLNEVRLKTDKKSWYAVARALGFTDQLVYNYRHRHRTLSDESAIQVADFLGYPPELVFLWMQVERLQGTETGKYWHRLASTVERQNQAA